MILAIETSSSVCAVGFYFESELLVDYQSEAPMKHSELVGKYVEEGLKKTNRPVRLVVVAIGPGSFTGLRIGLSYAQGFCFGKNIPIIGISNHQVLARQVPNDKATYTVIDAHRQELYCAKHRLNDLREIDSQTIIKSAEIENIIPNGSQLIFLKGTLEEKKIDLLAKRDILCTPAYYRIDILAETGRLQFYEKGGKNPEDLQPMYIRPFAGVK